jgi:hypothetical protein
MSDYSIYPKAIDGFAQLPLFVDNITPVSAEGLNRIRSAIINIETALGIFPQGDFDTVAERLDNINISSNGLKEITERLEVVESDVAAIEAILADFPSDLQTVLVAGSETGGSNIIISSGDEIQAESSATIRSAVSSSIELISESGSLNVVASKVNLNTGSINADITVDSGDPNGVVSAVSGSLYLDSGGDLYIGQGGTSWDVVAKGSGALSSLSLTTDDNLSEGDLLIINSSGNVELGSATSTPGNEPRIIGSSFSSYSIGNTSDINSIPGRLIPVKFSSPPLASSNGGAVYLSTSPGLGTLTPPGASGTAIFVVGILQGADGVTSVPEVIFQPNLVGYNS